MLNRISIRTRGMLGGLAAVALLALVSPAAPAGAAGADGFAIVEHRDIDYVPGKDYAEDKDKLDVFMPEGVPNAPVVVYFHGGALQAGTKAIGEGLARQLARRGIGLVTANYRLSPAVMHPAHMEDATAAFAWTKKHIASYGGDPGRVFLSGHSAGAYLAALMAVDPSYLEAHGLGLSDVRGVIPISPFLYVEDPDVAPRRPKTVWGTNPEVWLQASVTPYVGDGKPPMLLIYADGDDAWRREQNQRLAAELAAKGAKAAAVEIADRTHGSVNSKMADDGDPGMLQMARFVERH
jgi:acetyl esterase/lipase